MSADHERSEGKAILLVEDNLHNRKIFSGVLAHYGFEVREAANGEEALEQLKERRPDLILMDLSLPVIDGWETTRRIRKIPELADIPIIALTAHAMHEDRDRALEAGCDDYLAKPISPKKVVEAVKRTLAEREAR